MHSSWCNALVPYFFNCFFVAAMQAFCRHRGLQHHKKSWDAAASFYCSAWGFYPCGSSCSSVFLFSAILLKKQNSFLYYPSKFDGSVQPFCSQTWILSQSFCCFKCGLLGMWGCLFLCSLKQPELGLPLLQSGQNGEKKKHQWEETSWPIYTEMSEPVV